MVDSNQRPRKTIKALLIAILLSFLHTHSADAIPTAEDINSLSEKAHQTIGTFMQQSFRLRMAYEYSLSTWRLSTGDKFLSNRDRETLQALAKSAGDKLPAIVEEQENTKKQIEDYQGDDWDQRYGSTGLWRKLAADLHITNEYKCRIDYNLALTSPKPQRNVILQQILTQLDSSNTVHISAESQLLRAKIYSLLSPAEPDYTTSAQKDFDLLTERSDMKHSTAFKTAIERIKLFGPTDPDQIKTLAESIAKSNCKDDIELVLPLAFLQLKYEPQSLDKTLQTWPQIEDFLGSLILSDLSYRIEDRNQTIQYLEQINIVEAELAAQSAWKNKTKDYKNLLTCLSNMEKFHTPLILYVTAIALADSSPADTINLLIKASKLQSPIGGQKSNRLNMEAHAIAGQAAQLAYSLYSNDTANCRLAAEAFENYYSMTDENFDEKLEYIYTVILRDCGKVEKSKFLLEKIANRPDGNYRNRAKLDLITTAITQHQSENPEKFNLIIQQLYNFITGLGLNNEDNRVRTEAITIYCRLLFQSAQNSSARKVLDVLTDYDIAVDPNLNIMKATAQRKLGKLDEAAESLCKVVNSSSDKYTETIRLLSEFIDKLDYYQAKSDGFQKIVRDCYELACYCRDYAEPADNLKAAIILAEISTYVPEKEMSKSSAARELITGITKNDNNNDIDLLRCRARLLTSQGNFAQAASLWAQLAKIQKNNNEANQQSWKWWRAKFYELDCIAKMPRTDNRDLLHTIEVLENTYSAIPPFWAEKLSLLKIHCRQSK